MGWGANVLTESGVNDDTLRDSTKPDHTRDLTTDPDKDPTTPNKHEEGEAEKTTEEEIDEPTDELANESHTDYENAPDNQNDGKVTNTTMEEPHEVHDKWTVIPVTQCHTEYSTISKAIQHR